MAMLMEQAVAKNATPAAAGAALVPTALGEIGLVWNVRGLERVLLADPRPGAVAGALAERGPLVSREVWPAEIARLADALADYAEGAAVDFEFVKVDESRFAPFHARVYAAAREVAWGETVTYGELARRAGAPGAARAAGQAMARNPVPLVIPCHRVLAGSGKLTGFSAPGGVETKRRLLALERGEGSSLTYQK